MKIKKVRGPGKKKNRKRGKRMRRTEGFAEPEGLHSILGLDGNLIDVENRNISSGRYSTVLLESLEDCEEEKKPSARES